MTHSLTFLSQLRQTLSVLDDDSILSFIEHLLKNGKKETVIIGIFRQLYNEGEKNNKSFLKSLTVTAQKLLTNMP